MAIYVLFPLPTLLLHLWFSAHAASLSHACIFTMQLCTVFRSLLISGLYIVSHCLQYDYASIPYGDYFAYRTKRNDYKHLDYLI